MIGHITKLFSLSCICGGYYYVSRHSKVNLQSKYLGKIFRLIDEHVLSSLFRNQSILWPFSNYSSGLNCSKVMTNSETMY